MRVSSNCHCPKFCCSTLSVYSCLPCLPVSRHLDGVQNVLSTPTPAALVLEKKLSDENKIEGKQNEEKDWKKIDNPLKSSLKKPGCTKSEQATKGNVKWMDFLGKELVEIKEFESIDSEELIDNDMNTACMCTVQ